MNKLHKLLAVCGAGAFALALGMAGGVETGAPRVNMLYAVLLFVAAFGCWYATDRVRTAAERKNRCTAPQLSAQAKRTDRTDTHKAA